jgi:hypothetical protein
VTDEELFLRTLEDLRSRMMQPPDEYNMLRIAGLLRELLLDGNDTLLHQINRTRRLRIIFRAPASANPNFQRGNLPPYVVSATLMASRIGSSEISGQQSWSAPLLDLTLDQFLAVHMIHMNEETFNVRDIILYLANTHGGVHRGAPKKPVQHSLQRAIAMFPREQTGGSVHMIMAGVPLIVHTVLEALQPLVPVIHAEASGTEGAPSP